MPVYSVVQTDGTFVSTDDNEFMIQTKLVSVIGLQEGYAIGF